MSIKVVFLDIDGVLNTESSNIADSTMKTWPDWGEKADNGSFRPYMGIDTRLVAKLNDLWAATGADIVISSSWREQNTVVEMRARLVSAGLDPRIEIIGLTPVYNYRLHQPRMEMRRFEILNWIDEFGDDVESYVVLDDSLYADVPGHFVQVDSAVGLSDLDVMKAIAILQPTANPST